MHTLQVKVPLKKILIEESLSRITHRTPFSAPGVREKRSTFKRRSIRGHEVARGLDVLDS